jgi:hypothetical protein
MFRPGQWSSVFQVATSAANRPSGLASTRKNDPVGPLRHSSNPAVIPAPTLIFTGEGADTLFLGAFLAGFGGIC